MINDKSENQFGLIEFQITSKVKMKESKNKKKKSKFFFSVPNNSKKLVFKQTIPFLTAFSMSVKIPSGMSSVEKVSFSPSDNAPNSEIYMKIANKILVFLDHSLKNN